MRGYERNSISVRRNGFKPFLVGSHFSEKDRFKPNRHNAPHLSLDDFEPSSSFPALGTGGNDVSLRSVPALGNALLTHFLRWRHPDGIAKVTLAAFYADRKWRYTKVEDGHTPGKIEHCGRKNFRKRFGPDEKFEAAE